MRVVVGGWLLAGWIVGGTLGAGEPPVKSWRDGPVVYLLTPDEYRAYGRLETDEQRGSWIEGFWRALDPDPATTANEYRERYLALRQLADDWFRESTVAGWRTDRGRVLMLRGVPHAVRRDAGGPRGRDREVWSYEHSPGAPTPRLEIAFYRDEQGTFRLESEPAVAGVEDLADSVERRYRFYHDLRWSAPLPEAQYLQVAEILLRDTVDREGYEGMPWPELARPAGDVPRAAREPALAEDALDFAGQAFFFRAADGSTLALLSLDVAPNGAGEGPGGPYTAVAWLLRDSETGTTSVDTVPLRVAGGDAGGTLFGGRVYLDPGEYSLRWAIGEPGEGRLTVRTKALTVPGLEAPGLQASSIVPAESFGPARSGSPFAVGSEQVVPRPGATFHRGEPLRLYLQLYGARADERTGRQSVDVEFRFERAGRRRFRRHGKPRRVLGADGASMGLAMPVGGWPTGDYRVVVECRDRVSGASVTTRGAFRIVD